MKRLLVLLFAILMSIGLSTLTVSALDMSNNTDIAEPNGIYYQKFCDRYEYEYPNTLSEYEEIYFHYDEEGNVDWVMIYAVDLLTPPWEVHPYAVLGNRVLRCNDTHTPFVVGYGIYNVSEDEFKCLTSVWESDLQEDLQRVLSERGIGEIIGDVDKDGKLTVKDATLVQKYLAGIMQYPESDVVDGYSTSYYGEIKYISDFNRDGERNIKDATAIQKHIAGLPY